MEIEIIDTLPSQVRRESSQIRHENSVGNKTTFTLDELRQLGVTEYVPDGKLMGCAGLAISLLLEGEGTAGSGYFRSFDGLVTQPITCADLRRGIIVMENTTASR